MNVKPIGAFKSGLIRQVVFEHRGLKIQGPLYKATGNAKVLRRKARRMKKALSDRRKRQEGVMYSSGLFDTTLPGPSSSQEN